MPTIKSKTQFLKELIALKEVIDAGKISTAADKNGLKSTNLSKLITSLESRLHTKLISRSSKGVYPLEEAVKINETTEKIIKLLEVLFVEYGHSTKMTGCISIYSEEDYIGSYFFEKLQKFLQSYPFLKIKIFSGEKVDLDQMDLIISSNGSNLSRTRSLYKTEIQSHFYISDKYIQRHGKPENLSDLLENHFLCMRHSDFQHKEISYIIKTAKHLNITADETSIVFRVIQNGDAVGILPEWCGDFDPSVFRLDNVFISIKKDFDVMYNMKTKNAVMMKSVLSFLKNFNKEGEFSKNPPLN
ncbi:MAG: LysR family transcriptional regulator [Alphaproteobacteria bacterium]|nr:LysR family transcriptional regulator [Alphaproteobacteria bacterium]